MVLAVVGVEAYVVRTRALHSPGLAAERALAEHHPHPLRFCDAVAVRPVAAALPADAAAATLPPKRNSWYVGEVATGRERRAKGQGGCSGTPRPDPSSHLPLS